MIRIKARVEFFGFDGPARSKHIQRILKLLYKFSRNKLLQSAQPPVKPLLEQNLEESRAMESTEKKAGSSWSGRLGFMLAATGSAVGLGNLWKFPYIAGENGGGAFVVVYLMFIFLIALPVFFAEFIIGKEAKTNVIEAFGKILGKKSAWDYTGYLCILSLTMILTFYSVVGGWALYFNSLAFTGNLFQGGTKGIEQILPNLFDDFGTQLMFFVLFYVATSAVIVAGVQKGLERCCRIMMPILFFILIALVLYASTMQGFYKSLDFLFQWNPEKLTVDGILEALGHSFFTLSVAMGIVLVYGGYLDDDKKVGFTCVSVAFLDTLIALIGGIVIFSVVMSFPDIAIQPGPTLIFQTFPVLFNDLGRPYLVVNIFFLLFSFAAFSSSVSILEVPTSFLADRFKISRLKAVSIIGVFAIAVGMLHIGSFNPDTRYELFGFGSFEIFDYISTKVIIPITGLLFCLFAGYKLPLSSFQLISDRLVLIKPIYWCLRYFCPIAILVVMAKQWFF